jgi:hypothetical protein
VVPSTPPQEPAQPTSDAPGAMRVEKRAREDRRTRERTTPPPRPSQPPLARQGPEHHDQIVPPWGQLATVYGLPAPSVVSQPLTPE